MRLFLQVFPSEPFSRFCLINYPPKGRKRGRDAEKRIFLNSTVTQDINKY